METISATELKRQCPAILDRVSPDGIVITKHGKPVAKLIPLEAASSTASSDLIGSLAGKISVPGGILTTDLRWDAERPPRYAPRH